MKKTVLTALIFLVSFGSFSQSLQKEVQHPDIAGKMFRNPKGSKSKIQGSPYTQKMFAAANVEKINLKAYMRYNVHADEFEFISAKNDTLILDRLEDFGVISFPGLNRKYVLTTYVLGKGKLEYGYLIDVYQKGDFGFFKKENVVFVDEKVAKTTLETYMPPKYSKQEDTFFLKNAAAGIVEFPDGKKALTKLFPDKKQAIEDFLKTNKIDFDSEADLIRIVNFLAGS